MGRLLERYENEGEHQADLLEEADTTIKRLHAVIADLRTQLEVRADCHQNDCLPRIAELEAEAARYRAALEQVRSWVAGNLKYPDEILARIDGALAAEREPSDD